MVPCALNTVKCLVEGICLTLHIPFLMLFSHQESAADHCQRHDTELCWICGLTQCGHTYTQTYIPYSAAFNLEGSYSVTEK